MLQSITIRNFRCFKEISCNQFARINLFIGKNNVGKTTLLEGLFLFFGRQNPQLALNIQGFRGSVTFQISANIQEETPWDPLFYDYDVSKKIEISSMNGSKNTSLKIFENQSDLLKIKPTKGGKIDYSSKPIIIRELSYKCTDDNVLRSISLTNEGVVINNPGIISNMCFYLPSKLRQPEGLDKERAKIFSKLESTGRINEILEIMQIIEPRLISVSLGFVVNDPIIRGNIGRSKLIPINLMGEGTERLLDILLRAISAENGAIVIDEIENGFHHSVQSKIWEALGIISKRYNVQIFATSHSLEFIKNAHNAMKDGDYDFRVHRIEKFDTDEFEIITLDKQALDTALKMRLEVR